MSSFLKNVSFVIGGTFIAQIINIASIPLLTRIYTPEEMGELNFFISTLTLLLVFSSLRYEVTISLPTEEHKAKNQVVLSILLLLIFSLGVFVIMLFTDIFLPDLGAFEYKYFLPLALIFSGLFVIFQKWSLRNRDYKEIGKALAQQSIVGNISKILFGFFGLGTIGLIIGQIMAVSFGMKALSKKFLRVMRHKPKLIELYSGIKRYREYPIYTGPAKLLLTFSLQSPVFFLTILYGEKYTGLYGLALSITMMPMSLIGQSISNVFYAEAANYGKENPQKIKKLSKELFWKLVPLATIITLFFLLFAPYLFSLIFGKEWERAGDFSRILSFMLFFNFICTPISNVAEIFEKVKSMFMLSLVRMILILIVFYLSYVLNLSVDWVISLYSIVMSISYIMLYFMAQNILTKAHSFRN